MKDILLDEIGDLRFENGDLVIGESEMQEVGLILQSNQGEWKNDPVLGPNLVQMNKKNESKFDIEQRTKIHLTRDGKDYNRIRRKIKTILK